MSEAKVPTQAQRERQNHREKSGRYDKVNPCYVCGRSAGVDYCSHGDTDYLFGDALLVICDGCSRALQALRGADALVRAKEMRAARGLDPMDICCDEYLQTVRRRQAEEGL